MNLLTSLRYLVALNEHKHFGRAAQACNVTQPALSNAIRALESEFEVTIVKRDRAFSGLTPEGERVLASAQYMLREHANLQTELRSETHLPRGPLRIGAVPTAVPIASAITIPAPTLPANWQDRLFVWAERRWSCRPTCAILNKLTP